MSTSALAIALLLGILFAAGDRIAMHVGDKRSRNLGVLVWTLVVLVPAVGLAVLSWKVAIVAVAASCIVSAGIARAQARKKRQCANPFEPVRPPLGWLR